MKKTTFLFTAAIIFCSIAFGQNNSQEQRLRKHLYTLAADSLNGRAAGTDDSRRAADYIRRQWEQIGLKPFIGNSYNYPFIVDGGMAQYATATGTKFTNLVAIIEGNDPVLKHEFIVIGAHYDHVGVKGEQIYNGADDNASGSSCLIEVARQLTERQSQLKRSVIICAFDAEEIGLFGSKEMVNFFRKSDLLQKVKLMMSIDMVGWYQANGELILEGSGTIKDSKSLMQPKNLGIDIKVRLKAFENSLFTATDTEPFAEANIPTLAVTTGLKSPYHKPEDDADLIDYEGLNRVTDYVSALAVATSRSNDLASGKLAAKHHTKTFELGIAAGYNNSNLNFPDATFFGKSYCGFEGGLIFQYNLSKYFSLHANVLYNYSHNHLPAADDAFGKGYGMEQHTLLVPVTLQLGINMMGTGIYIGLGGFYGHELKGNFYGDIPTTNPAYDTKKNQWGLAWNICLRLGGHWQLDGTMCNQFNNLFNTSGGLPKARKSIYSVTLGYYF